MTAIKKDKRILPKSLVLSLKKYKAGSVIYLTIEEPKDDASTRPESE